MNLILAAAVALLLSIAPARAIDSGASSNYSLNTEAGYLSPSVTPGAEITGGSNIGNLTNGGGLAAAFDGTTTQARSASASKNTSTSGYDNTVGKDWGDGNTYTVARFKFWGTSDEGLLVTTATGYKLQGSNNGSDWTDLYAGTSNSGTGGVYDITSGIDTSTAYRYHRFNIQGNGGNSVGVAEVEFYEPSTTNNMTEVSTAQTADSTIGSVRVLLEYDPIDAITLNTDLTVEVTCDGGSNWAAATLEAAGTGQAGRLVAETEETSCGANTGTSFAARIKTFNNKAINIYGSSISVR